MATFDYFVGLLRCSTCGNVGRGTTTNMQTKMSKHPSLKEIGMCNSIDADWSAICEAGYLKIVEPPERDTITILETWDCPKCDKPSNWARIIIMRGKIELVESIVLSAEIVQGANYITEDCRYLLNLSTIPEIIVAALLEQLQNT